MPKMPVLGRVALSAADEVADNAKLKLMQLIHISLYG
jgi:hypothetical protein